MDAHRELVLNPLVDVPLLGTVVGKLDEAIAEVGLPLWLRAFVEIVLTGVLCFFLLRLLLRRVVPWLAEAAVRPTLAVTEVARATLLLPDLAVSTAVRRFGRVPPEPVHTYGSMVMAVVDGVQSATRVVLPKLAEVRRLNGVVLLIVLVAGFLFWNSQACATPSPCVSPVTAWKTSLDTWVASN